ncbi:MAG: Zn-ribbon domain-containing OB-fold protein [Chloroflexi bacterium]|nr:Zn-ribbon domain-containing OB-fold protein [Chloroflexota bacterium]
MTTQPQPAQAQRYEGPVPLPQQESDYYWGKCKEHELWLRFCNLCSQAYFYPRDLCPRCFSRNTTWVKASGRGQIYTFAIVYQIPRPTYKGPLPYIIALVKLEEGPIMPTNIVGVEADPAKLKIGMPVTVVFEDITEAISLPKFQLA